MPASPPSPFRLAAIEGQPRAIAVLTAALADGRIPNAWLFAGPKGVGKATSALALAAAVNCGASSAPGGLFGGAAPAPRSPADACGICASLRQFRPARQSRRPTLGATAGPLNRPLTDAGPAGLGIRRTTPVSLGSAAAG